MVNTGWSWLMTMDDSKKWVISESLTPVIKTMSNYNQPVNPPLTTIEIMSNYNQWPTKLDKIKVFHGWRSHFVSRWLVSIRNGGWPQWSWSRVHGDQSSPLCCELLLVDDGGPYLTRKYDRLTMASAIGQNDLQTEDHMILLVSDGISVGSTCLARYLSQFQIQ